MNDSVVGRMGRWVAQLEPANVPPACFSAARYQVLNMIAAVHAAARSSETAALRGVGGFAGSGRATCLVDGSKRAPHDAAFDNAAYSMAQDYDDIVWMGHTCHSAVFAALAVAEHEGLDAVQFLTAVVAANEVAGRLGASSFLGPLNGQMWTFIHLIGAAAASAKLLQLDEEQCVHALAISLAQPNFALQPGFMTPSSKLLAASTPTATGIQAAYYARAGMTGEPRIVEDVRGFWSRFSYLPLPSMLEGLGDFWTTQTLTIKTYPGCHYFQTACAALEQLRDRVGQERLRGFQSMHIETTKLGIEATRFAREYAEATGRITPVNVNFDLRVTAALMVLAGRLGGAEVEPVFLDQQASAIGEMLERISVRHAPKLTLRTVGSVRALGSGRAALGSLGVGDVLALMGRYRREYRSELVGMAEAGAWARAISAAIFKAGRAPEHAADRSAVPLYFPNRVTVELADGSTESARVDLPPGSFCSADMPQAVRAKFLRETEASLGRRGSERAYQAGLVLGQGASLEDLVALVAQPAS